MLHYITDESMNFMILQINCVLQEFKIPDKLRFKQFISQIKTGTNVSIFFSAKMLKRLQNWSLTYIINAYFLFSENHVWTYCNKDAFETKNSWIYFWPNGWSQVWTGILMQSVFWSNLAHSKISSGLVLPLWSTLSEHGNVSEVDFCSGI